MAKQQTQWDSIMQNIRNIRSEMLIMNAAFIILGILMVSFPDKINGLICQGIGAALCIWGILRVIKYFMARAESAFGSFGLVQGGAMIGFGIFFLANPDFFVNIIDISLAIILLVMAVIKVQYAFDFLKMDSKRWWIQLVGAVIMAVIGILALTKPFGIANIIMVFIGCGLIFSGIWDLASILRVSRIIKNTLNGSEIKSKEKEKIYTTAEDK